MIQQIKYAKYAQLIAKLVLPKLHVQHARTILLKEVMGLVTIVGAHFAINVHIQIL